MSASFDIDMLMEKLEKAIVPWDTPAVTIISRKDGDPFKVLVSCILSLRTKDTTTGPASARLFALADSAAKMLQLDKERIEKAIYPVGFYRNKAAQLLEICRIITAEHAGSVPDSLEELLKFKGVGRKTANLVVTMGFGSRGYVLIPMYTESATAGAMFRRKLRKRPNSAYGRSFPVATG